MSSSLYIPSPNTTPNSSSIINNRNDMMNEGQKFQQPNPQQQQQQQFLPYNNNVNEINPQAHHFDDHIHAGDYEISISYDGPPITFWNNAMTENGASD